MSRKFLNKKSGSAQMICACGIIALMLMGCRKDESASEKVDPYDQPYARMEDPAYTNALTRQMDEQRELMKARSQIEAALEEAKKTAAAETIEQLTAQMKELEKKFEANHAKTQKMVGDRIRQENRAIAARQAREAAEQKAKKQK